MSIVLQNQSNPFESIRHIDSDGNEYWMARDLMSLLGYAKWQRFEEAIARGMISLQNTGGVIEDHFTASGNLVKRRQGGGSIQQDYKLSRYACYLVAMNGDPRKSEIAAAQSYFAIKAREAETAIPQLNEELEMLKLQNENLRMSLELRKLDNTMLTLHGTSTVLALRGMSDQIVREEIIVTEVVEPQTQKSQRILSAEQLKKEVKKRVGQNIPSLKWFTDELRKHNRDDLLIPVTRHATNEYINPDRLEEAITIVFGNSRQVLFGE